MQTYGEVLTEHIGLMLDDPSKNIADNDEAIFIADKELIDQADILIAEVSNPSLGVGREIAYAQETRKIPIHCLCFAGLPLSAMINGNPGVHNYTYHDTNNITNIIANIFRS